MDVHSSQIFFLSPASCSGRRAAILLNETASFDLARRLRSDEGAPLGEVFSFLSGLYFRGKLAYARAFSSPEDKDSSIWIITAGRGLLRPEKRINAGQLREFTSVPIDLAEPRYRDPLAQDVGRLAGEMPVSGRAILLGSIATEKYAAILQAAFGERLMFPAAFIGRGDMSRGGLMLRAVDEGRELHYISLAGAIRRGRRPSRLPPRKE